MTRQHRRMICSASLLCIAAITHTSAQKTEVYRRAVPLEARSGVIEIRTVYSVKLDALDLCDGQPGGKLCRRELTFPRVMRIDFFMETRSSGEAGNALVREPRGTVVLALRPQPEMEDALDTRIRDELRALASDAFDAPFAATEGGAEPWIWIGGASPEASWACFMDGDTGSVLRYSGDLQEQPDGSWEAVSVTHMQWPFLDYYSTFCNQASEATESAYPDVLQTMPIPQVLQETVVEVIVADDLLDEAYTEDLTPFPENTSLEIRQTEERLGSTVHSHSNDGMRQDDVWVERGPGKSDSFETRIATAMAGDIGTDALGRNSWAARWSVRTVERSLGPMPSTRVIERHDLYLALLPAPPAGSGDADPEIDSAEPRPVKFDEDAFLESVSVRLDARATTDIETVQDMIRDGADAVERQGWILAICRDDGTAIYGLPPAIARTTVTNSDAFCARVDAAVGAH